MNARVDMTGREFGRLTVIEFAAVINGQARWRCRCVCGEAVVVCGNKLRSGWTRSCGCLAVEMTLARTRTHGMAPTVARPPEYAVWAQMVQRCTNPNNTRWSDYGGRGITVCEEWRRFDAWFRDMGRRPSARHQIDRVDNDLGYERLNCRWATREEQVRKQARVLLTMELADVIRKSYATGRFTHAQLARRFGVATPTVGNVLRNEHWKITVDGEVR